MGITIRSFRPVGQKDVEEARDALRAAEVAGHVRRGRGSTRYTLTVNFIVEKEASEAQGIIVPYFAERGVTIEPHLPPQGYAAHTHFFRFPEE